MKALIYQGKRIIDVHHEPQAAFGIWGDPALAWTASVRGWYRVHPVGTGRTRDAAIADLARQIGETPQQLLARAWIEENTP